MLATQDVCDIEVPDEDTRSRGEQLIERARFLSMDQLMFAKEVAEFAATEEYQEWGDTTSIDWIRLHCHMTGPQAANYVAAGEHFDDLPQTVLAMAEGKGWLRPHRGHGQDRRRTRRLTHGEGLR